MPRVEINEPLRVDADTLPERSRGAAFGLAGRRRSGRSTL